MTSDLQLTSGEVDRLRSIASKISDVGQFLSDHRSPDENDPASLWYSFVNLIRMTLGNISNDASFLGMLMVKDYLTTKHHVHAFDASAKAEGAPGLDIDVRTSSGKRIVGELKTTFPYKVTSLGAQQQAMFFKDFAKLEAANADAKYLFVTEESTFEIVGAKYAARLEGVCLVLLPGTKEKQF